MKGYIEFKNQGANVPCDSGVRAIAFKTYRFPNAFCSIGCRAVDGDNTTHSDTKNSRSLHAKVDEVV